MAFGFFDLDKYATVDRHLIRNKQIKWREHQVPVPSCISLPVARYKKKWYYIASDLKTALDRNDSERQALNMEKNDKKAKAKYKFTAMDYITIGFTAVIVIIMVVFLLKALKPEWFEKKNKSNTPPAATQQNTDSQATENTPVDQPTEAPFYSGIGNTYGNMSNNAAEAEIDDRLYYVDTEESGKAALKVDDGETTRVLVSGEAAISSVNVIKDPFAYADVAGSVAYKVMFLDGSGNICAVTDGPFPSGDNSDVSEENATVTEKKAIADGRFKSFVSVGAYLYGIDTEGSIVKVSLDDASKAILSKNKYEALCVYFGSIYALCSDGDLYVLTTSARPAEGDEAAEVQSGDDDAVPGVDKYEMLVAEGQFRTMCLFDDWIYGAGEEGLVRYDADNYGRDSLSGAFAPFAVNVDRRGIFLLVDAAAYSSVASESSSEASSGIVLLQTSARDLLLGKTRLVGTIPADSVIFAPNSYRITLSTDRIIVSSTDGGSVFNFEYEGNGTVS